MSIHHLDTFRYWFGTPDRVLASTRPDPRTTLPAHRRHQPLHPRIRQRLPGRELGRRLDRPGPRRLRESDIGIRWRVEGTDGLARGTIGWPSYPARTPSTLDFTTRQQPGYWLQPRWQEVWFPDAFVGTMAQLLCAVEDGTEPEISGRDNLETIALCEAVFAAAQRASRDDGAGVSGLDAGAQLSGCCERRGRSGIRQNSVAPATEFWRIPLRPRLSQQPLNNGHGGARHGSAILLGGIARRLLCIATPGRQPCNPFYPRRLRVRTPRPAHFLRPG